MDIEMMKDKIEKLESVVNNIMYLKPEERIINPTNSSLEDLKALLNEVFEENKCTDILYTLNTDKQFFAVRVNPAMNGSDAMTILATDENVRLVSYQIEFDSKLFEIGLDSSEITAILLYEIGAVMDSSDIFDKLRALVDINLINNDDVINIRQSVNYSQLMIFAVKDTLYKLSNILFKDSAEELLIPIIQAADLSAEIVSAKEKILASIAGVSDSMRTPVPIILDWALFVYKDIKRNRTIVYDTLVDAKSFTGSKLEIRDLQACINALDKLDTIASLNENMNMENQDLFHFFNAKNLSAVNELSIFRALKKNGLRSLENELYEFSMHVKNCTDAQDAYLIMRGLNSRLGILEDYLYNEYLSENDRRHWEAVANAYRDLRITLSKKKFEDKQYGLFFDYSALDRLDKKSEE